MAASDNSLNYKERHDLSKNNGIYETFSVEIINKNKKTILYLIGMHRAPHSDGNLFKNEYENVIFI